MQDNYVGDIGDYGKYGLLRNVTAAGLQLAVNWYRVVLPPSNEQDDGECISCSKKPKQKDGKYTSYLEHPEKYRHYDPNCSTAWPVLCTGKSAGSKRSRPAVCCQRHFSQTL